MTDTKPATDERIDAARIEMGAPHYTARLWQESFVRALIARIDAERASAERAEARVKALEDALHPIIRTAEMSAAIMRDPKRTGGWEGSERVASSFERLAERIAALKAREPTDA